MVHEDFYVHDNPWDAATQTRIKRPGLGFLLCIGCSRNACAAGLIGPISETLCSRL
jgi:hypothetical protein